MVEIARGRNCVILAREASEIAARKGVSQKPSLANAQNVPDKSSGEAYAPLAMEAYDRALRSGSFSQSNVANAQAVLQISCG